MAGVIPGWLDVDEEVVVKTSAPWQGPAGWRAPWRVSTDFCITYKRPLGLAPGRVTVNSRMGRWNGKFPYQTVYDGEANAFG